MNLKTLKPKKIQDENLKIIEELAKGPKAEAVHYTKEEAQEIIDSKKGDLIKAQKAYRLSVKDYENAIAGLDYQRKRIEYGEQDIFELKVQLKLVPDHVILWEGGKYPIRLLEKLIALRTSEVESYRTGFNRDVETFVDLTNSKKYKLEELQKKYKLTDKEIDDIMVGKYVKELKE